MQTKKNKPKRGREKKENRKLKPRDVRVYNYVHKKSGFRRLFARNRVCREGVGGVGVCVYVYTAYVYQFSTEWACRTPSPKCNLPLGQVSHGDI